MRGVQVDDCWRGVHEGCARGVCMRGVHEGCAREVSRMCHSSLWEVCNSRTSHHVTSHAYYLHPPND